MKEWSLYQISTKGRILSGPQSGSWRVLNSKQNNADAAFWIDEEEKCLSAL